MEFNKHLAKVRALNEDNCNNNIDDKTPEQAIFVDRLIKLALEDKVFTDANVCDELKTVLLAVRMEIPEFWVFSGFAIRFSE